MLFYAHTQSFMCSPMKSLSGGVEQWRETQFTSLRMKVYDFEKAKT